MACRHGLDVVPWHRTLGGHGSLAALALVLSTLVPALQARGDADALTLSVVPYAWLPSIEGTVGAKGLTTDVNASFVDIWDNTDTHLGFFGRIEGHTGPWGLFVDGGYMQLGMKDISIIGGGSVNNEMGIIDFGLMYRVLDLPKAAGQEDSRLAVDATVGGQYWTMGLEIDPNLRAARSTGQAWIDPMIGVRATYNLGKHVQFVLGGEIGGFGTSSQFAWSAIGAVGYVFRWGSVDTGILVGYKAIGDDYTHGSGRSEFTWDTVMHGPVLALSFTF